MEKNAHVKNVEDYCVKATLNVSGIEIPHVLCKIFLPERITDKPSIIFKPTKEQYSKITRSYFGSFEAQLIGYDKKVNVSISSPNVYFSDMETKHWGPDFSESTLKGEPQHLKVVKYLGTEHDVKNTQFTFWLTPNSMLNPVTTHSFHYTGDTECKRLHRLIFPLTDDYSLTFDIHYKNKKINNEDSLSWSYLVCISEIGISAMDVDSVINTILPAIDKFLLIASFGSRTRTACVGWSAYDHSTTTTYYRGDYSFPTGESEPSFDQGLVWKKNFDDYLKICFPAFQRFFDQEALLKAIMSVVPGRKKVIEESFLSIFAGLESLILAYRKEYNLEYVIPAKQEWKTVKKSISDNISQISEQQLSRKQKNYMKGKLNELNRISLRKAYKKFCKHYDIDLSDLWPLFGDEKPIGLSEIRNKLIHGETFTDDLSNALSIANENLKFMLERVLIKILGYPVEKTEVSPVFLKKHSVALKEMKSAQDILFQNAF